MKSLMTLVLLVLLIVVVSIVATAPVRAYPSDALFAKQINQTAGAIITYRQPSEIQKYINDDPTNIEQVLQQLVWQIYRTSNQSQSLQVVNEINTQVTANPEGFTGDSIFWFGYRTANGQTGKVTQIIAQVTPPPTAVQSIVSFNNMAINDATYLGDGAQRFFQGVQAVITGNPQTAGFSQSSYTTDICNKFRSSDISDNRRDGQTPLGEPSDIFATESPTGAIGWRIQYDLSTKSIDCNLNSSILGEYNYFTKSVSNDQPLLRDEIRQVLGQIILETALGGGQASAQHGLINLVNPLVSNPTGSLSKAIFLIASVQASGNILAANGAVKTVADYLACGGDVKKIPQIVDTILSSSEPTAYSPCPAAGQSVPEPPSPNPHLPHPHYTLSVAIKITKNPLVICNEHCVNNENEQIINVRLSDDTNKTKKIVGANVTGEVTYASEPTRFSGITDKAGQMSWKIGGEWMNGTYSVTAQASATGYLAGSKRTTFTVITSAPRPLLTTLSVSIGVADSTIAPGGTQFITVGVTDDTNKSKRIVGAVVNGNVPGFNTKFSGVTDSTGITNPPYELEISGDAVPGQYKVTADATATGYNKGSATTTFTVNNATDRTLLNTAHCDQQGYPSCYNIGYQAGKNAPGNGCPSGHSQNYCAGWNAGAGNPNPFPQPGSTAHCDQQGYPSCYSIGYQAGKNAPGNGCPSGHSQNYCAGWEAGSRSGNGGLSSNSGNGTNTGHSNSTGGHHGSEHNKSSTSSGGSNSGGSNNNNGGGTAPGGGDGTGSSSAPPPAPATLS
jgi:hypothetical protein